MKRGKTNKKKEITKIRSKKTKNLTINKRIKKERAPDLLKEMYSGLRLLGKKYKNFREKQKIKKQKEEQIKLKEQEEQRLQEQEEQRLQEQEERKLQKEQKLKEEERQRLEKEQRPKEEGKRLNGKVKWFNGAKGYGFIERKGEEKDIFVHFSAVKKSGLKSLEEGEQLTFEIKNSDKGPSAINLQKVTNLEKAPVLKLVKKN